MCSSTKGDESCRNGKAFKVLVPGHGFRLEDLALVFGGQHAAIA
jgi:hypothetical protein